MSWIKLYWLCFHAIFHLAIDFCWLWGNNPSTSWITPLALQGSNVIHFKLLAPVVLTLFLIYVIYIEKQNNNNQINVYGDRAISHIRNYPCSMFRLDMWSCLSFFSFGSFIVQEIVFIGENWLQFTSSKIASTASVYWTKNRINIIWNSIRSSQYV